VATDQTSRGKRPRLQRADPRNHSGANQTTLALPLFDPHESARFLEQFLVATPLLGFYNGTREFGIQRSLSPKTNSD